MLRDADVSEHISFAQAAKLMPRGVICLLSALVFHELTTQVPFQVWMAIDPAARLPKEESASHSRCTLLGVRPRERDRRARDRRGTCAHLRIREDDRRLLQVPQQDRSRRGDRGVARLLGPTPVHDG